MSAVRGTLIVFGLCGVVAASWFMPGVFNGAHVLAWAFLLVAILGFRKPERRDSAPSASPIERN